MQTKQTITPNTFSAEMLETNQYACFIENSVQMPPLISTATKNDIQVQFYQSLHQAQEYYHFGMPMQSRTFTGNGYKFGFNGQEKEDDIYGEGNTYSAEYWMYDSRLGRRWNLDPKPNPSISQYNCFAGNPIWYSDVLGDTIRINYTVGEDRQLKQFTYTPDMEYTGDNAFLTKTVTALNKVNEGNVGSGMIGELHSTEKDITIMQHTKNVADGLNVGFNPESKIAGMN